MYNNVYSYPNKNVPIYLFHLYLEHIKKSRIEKQALICMGLPGIVRGQFKRERNP